MVLSIRLMNNAMTAQTTALTAHAIPIVHLAFDAATALCSRNLSNAITVNSSPATAAAIACSPSINFLKIFSQLFRWRSIRCACRRYALKGHTRLIARLCAFAHTPSFFDREHADRIKTRSVLGTHEASKRGKCVPIAKRGAAYAIAAHPLKNSGDKTAA